MSNVGHGHVIPRDDGGRARCGGPALCPECKAEELAGKYATDKPIVEILSNISAAEIFHMQPGDLLVLHLPQQISQAEYHEMSNLFRTLLPEGVKTMVLAPGAILEVVRQDKKEQENI